MQDAAAFFRQRAGACFHRRRKHPVNSEDWRHWGLSSNGTGLLGKRNFTRKSPLSENPTA
jgi:hypothetical protein